MAAVNSTQSTTTTQVPEHGTQRTPSVAEAGDSGSDTQSTIQSTTPDESSRRESIKPPRQPEGQLRRQTSRRSDWTTSEAYDGHPDDHDESFHDLEKSDTAASGRAGLGQRVSRVQTLTRRRAHDEAFTHPLAQAKTGPDVLVTFEGKDDPYHPLNWPFRKKCITTMLYGLITMGATLSSSIYSPTVKPISQEYGVGEEVSLLGISLLLAGFGLGPLIWGPVSEIYGRKMAVLLPYFIGAMFNFGSGAGENIQTILICRFFAGLFSSAPVTNTGGVLGDIWHPTHRGTAIVMYAFAVVGGPTFGPIIGGAIIVSGVNWRWTNYITGIYMTVFWAIGMIVLDESYSPVLLVQKATRLRISTGNWALHAKHEEWDPSLKEMVMKFGVRPFQMLMTPICFCVALFASFVYGILYGNLSAFPIEFEGERGWNPLVGSLPFIALLLGTVVGGCLNILNNRFYVKRWKAAGGDKPIPEARLPPMMGGSFLFTSGLFIFAWTSNKDIHWIAPNIGIFLLGIGFFTIFQASLNYLIDTFQRYAASAVAANTFLRSVFACAFPLFVGPMYDRIGIDWGTSVFGFFSILLIPIPFVFYIYGPTIRKKGKYSTNMG